MPKSKKTHLFDFHKQQNAKIINFAGWDMPFSYDGTLKEHHYVRENAGYFDVSHMGRLKLDYSQITEINELICSELNNIDNTKALYSIFINDNGGSIDDVIFWKFQDELILICNAANTEKIKVHLDSNNITYDDLTESSILIAIQGKNAIDLLSSEFEIPEKFSTMKKNNYTYARTGYTGEDGLEVMCSNENAAKLMHFLKENDIKPCGLGARDTLRLEASLPLYGFELSDNISPIEAGLKWTITNQNEYKGKEVIETQIQTKKHKSLRKFKINARQIARTDTLCTSNGINGLVTSGNISPILGHPIGFIIFETNPVTDLVEFQIRGNLIEGKLLNKRFLK